MTVYELQYTVLYSTWTYFVPITIQFGETEKKKCTVRQNGNNFPHNFLSVLL